MSRRAISSTSWIFATCSSLSCSRASFAASRFISRFASSCRFRHMSLTTLRLFPITSSIVEQVRLRFRRRETTRTLSLTDVPRTCMLVRGGKHISFSCGYCEIQLSSAPLSIMPVWISKTVPALWPDAYCMATSRSVVVLINPYSMPPFTPASSFSQNCFGRRPSLVPRMTVQALDVLLAFTSAETNTWMVVAYRFTATSLLLPGGPPHKLWNRSRILLGSGSHCRGPPRHTALYFSNRGPEYRHRATASASSRGFSPSFLSSSFFLAKPRRISARFVDRGFPVFFVSSGHCSGGSTPRCTGSLSFSTSSLSFLTCWSHSATSSFVAPRLQVSFNWSNTSWSTRRNSFLDVVVMP
mmetsp:Transcript_11890/g.33205  ORF Transcript_11890/g.33205 Transcript_11890/m.33205 type:complete len:355 (-) Transcript_11890:1230-2294(-)